MVILDEQLLGRNIEIEIAKWYKGNVRFIIDLRPHTVIKDDAIPELLRQQNRPVFVTINEKDFWRKVSVDNKFCIVCFSLNDSRANEIPQSLRILFQYPMFKTKEKRMGKIVRVTDKRIRYYSLDDREIKTIP